MQKNTLVAVIAGLVSLAVLITMLTMVYISQRDINSSISTAPNIGRPQPISRPTEEPKPIELPDLKGVLSPFLTSPSPAPAAPTVAKPQPAPVKKDIREEDRDKDGKADTWLEFKNNIIAEQISDENSDSKPDMWAQYNEAGDKITQQMDKNYDGKIDAWFTYRNNLLVGGKIDEDGDGKPDKTFGQP